MAITLADAKLNTLDDIDLNVIDEFRKSSWLLDNLTFDQAVNPAGGGATLTYGYTRLVAERGAAFRPYNTEYDVAEAKRARYSVDLVPLGGAFEIDRVLANLGPAASNEVTLQMQQVIKAARAFFADQVINGRSVATPNGEVGFDGLDVALAGSTTEVGAETVQDWTGEAIGDDRGRANDALDVLDAFLRKLDGPPSALLANEETIGRVVSLARRAGYYTHSEDAFGRQIEGYRGIPLVNLGAKAGTNDPVIPIEQREIAQGEAPLVQHLSDLYAVRLGLDGFHGVTTTAGNLVQQWMPDFTTAYAVKRGEVELGPVAVVLKATKAAAVLRNIKVR
ncbi:phage capsid protein [Streptomyces sp. NA04227]|uniref:major capsid protein n=1 Tax=Streptomyces sp. NA04227 TaxID=2742136 RepID=UPI0015904F50|nr:phage capsid protein [Streptomyces sp. NA04227]QKW08046.1 phage capsid protein [Streptomyces sp. NA04227]